MYIIYFINHLKIKKLNTNVVHLHNTINTLLGSIFAKKIMTHMKKKSFIINFIKQYIKSYIVP